MSSQVQNLNTKKKYDLAERTALFGEQIIEFAKILPDTFVTRPLVSQIIRSGTSVGANYMEADGAESKKDFRHKIAIAKKEAKETMHWLRMIAVVNAAYEDACKKLWQEAHELVLIFSAILLKNEKGDDQKT